MILSEFRETQTNVSKPDYKLQDHVKELKHRVQTSSDKRQEKKLRYKAMKGNGTWYVRTAMYDDSFEVRMKIRSEEM